MKTLAILLISSGLLVAHHDNGRGKGHRAEDVQTPEPQTWLMIGGGLIALRIWKRQRSK